MAASSSSSPFFAQPPSGLPVQPSSSPPPSSQQKKKRSLAGASSKYPDAEVIALSPKTLMATNRFICEVCNKGFQREQNLQLHRRGHNLPWKLKQRTNKDQVRRKVYLCPEPSCVHHDPARALGDLTGIKKHYSRKHGEKKFKCDKCSKRYAVQSDWKAHSKTCGTREYRCDCGTLFSRRDSFITHRAFCDALAQESARVPAPQGLTSLSTQLFGTTGAGGGLNVGLSQLSNHQLSSLQNHQNQPTTTNTSDILHLGTTQFNHLLAAGTIPLRSHQHHNNNTFFFSNNHQAGGELGFSNNNGGDGEGMLSGKLFSSGQANNHQLPLELPANNSNPFAMTTFLPHQDDHNNNNGGNTLFGGSQTGSVYPAQVGPNPCMSATALLQKAAQMGSTTSAATASATALLKGAFPPSSSATSSPPKLYGSMYGDQNDQNNLHDLINSLTGGNGAGSWAESPTGDNGNGQSQEQTGFNPSKSANQGGSSDGMTRDFLGVGEVVRTVSGGLKPSQREKQKQQQQGVGNVNNSGSKTTSSQAFGGSGNSFQ